jgi:starch phosphorylase
MSQEENDNQQEIKLKSNQEEEEVEENEEIEEKEDGQGKSQQNGQEGEAEEEEEEVEVEVKEKNVEKKKPPKNGLISIKRRKSLYEGFDEKQELFRPEFRFDQKDQTKEKMWELMDTYLPRDIINIQKSIVKHIEYTLATTRFNVDAHYLFQGTALSVRDRLLEQWNDTQLYIKINNPKKIFYLSIEFLLGRLLQNALVCIDLEKCYKEALNEFGIKIEEIYENENDPALGNGGLGRLAACYIDSMATLNFPAWGYGIRYEYGIFRQVIQNCEQKEFPDYWLTKGNPWEIMRLDTQFKVRFYGYCKDEWKNGKKVRAWTGGEEVVAVAYDTAVPGFNTFNCNTLRLWKSFPSNEFNFEEFNKGEHQSAMAERDQASYITSVLYPNDNSMSGKELRLKQEYFFSSASVQNIVAEFKKYNLSWDEFPKFNCIQLNDTHPTLALVELLRILVDENDVDYNRAFEIVKKTFNYTNHTVLPEALEKWGVDIFERLLPRHLELIYLINYFFMEEIKRKYPNDFNRMSKLSIIEESMPKKIRMANLCIVSSTKVNGVAKIHSGLLRTDLFKEFYQLWPEKFTNVTNGVTPRRWVHCAFPELSKLLTKYNGGRNDWLAEYDLLEEIPDKIKEDGTEKDFMERYRNAKLAAKLRLKAFVKKYCNIDIDETFLFDIMVKRIHEYKRQFMNCIYCIYRYLKLKKMSHDERKNVTKRVTFFGGKAAPGYALAKNVIKLINMVANVVNNDPDVNQYYKIVFLPDYKVSSAQIIIPAADISQHISTAGMEASGTSCMKFVMTGSIILGTHDGANIEIADKVGEDHIYFFGRRVEEVQRIREELRNGKRNYVGSRLKECFDAIYNNRFGNTSFMHDYLNGIINGGDYYLVCHDFYDYLEAQKKIDKDYQNKDEWDRKCVENICHMGFFSSDRSIRDYANDIWNVVAMEVPKPSLTKEQHLISTSNLQLFKPEEKEDEKQNQNQKESQNENENEDNNEENEDDDNEDKNEIKIENDNEQ